MAASIKTLHTFDVINDVYGNDWFTVNQFSALEISTHDNFATLKTLRKNSLVERKYIVSFYTIHAETDIQPDEWTGEEIQVSANEWAAPHYVPVYRVAC